MKLKHPTRVLKEVGGRNIFLEIPAILDANFGLAPWSSPKEPRRPTPTGQLKKVNFQSSKARENSSQTPRKNNLKKPT